MTENLLKRASWLELLYDLAFVALVAQLTYLAAAHHHTVADVLNIFIIGYTIFIAWWATTANRNLQDTETTKDKLLVQLQMIGAFIMSITMPAVFDGSYAGYFGAMAAIRFLQTFMMLRMYRMNPANTPQTYNMMQGFTIAGTLWFVSSLMIDPYHFVIAGAALTIDIFTPLTKGKGNKVYMLNVGHLQERLGLFLMLVLGESMLVVALANTAISTGIVQPTIVLSGLAIVLAIWWLYFEYMERIGEGVRPKNLFVFLQAHGWLYGSLILLAAGYKEAIYHVTPRATDMVLITLGLIGVTVSLTFIRTALHGHYWVRTSYAVGVGLLFAAISAWGITAGETYVSLLLSVVVTVLVAVFGTKRIVRYSK